MRQVVLGRLIFHQCSVITIMRAFSVHTRVWFPEGCHNCSIPTVHPLWYPVPKGVVSSPCSSHQAELGLPGCCVSPAMLPSSVATTMEIHFTITYLALFLSQLPEFWFWEGRMWAHQVLWLGDTCFPVRSRELWVIPFSRWTAVLWRWTGFAPGYQGEWTAFCI